MKLSSEVNFSLVHFQISHEGCWTNFARKYGIEISTLYTIADSQRNNIFGIVELKVRHKSSLKDFINDISRSESIREIISIRPINTTNNLFKMEINERFRGMLSGALNKFPIISRSDLIAGGIENEAIIVEDHYIGAIENELVRLGDLASFKVIRGIDINEFLNPVLKLTHQERYAILKAVEEGYYEIPRKMHLQDLSKKTGLSKATLEEYIRKAEMKLMNKARLWLTQS
jgi:predicted DNA binding protein